MVTHSYIKAAIAQAVASSNEVKEFCVDHFGRGALVIVDWYGAEGEPGEEESPFVFVYSANNTDEGGFVDEETYTARIVVGSCDPNGEPTKDSTTGRTETSNGLVTNGIGALVEEFRNIVEGVVKSASCGAVARTYRREEVSTREYPLEWAALEVEFFEPQTL